jgi:hypothetical protein
VGDGERNPHFPQLGRRNRKLAEPLTEVDIVIFTGTLLSAWREMVVQAREREERIAWLEAELERLTGVVTHPVRL